MIRCGFLTPASRKELTELARDGSAAHRLARRANALLLLDDGMSCEAVGKVLYMDDDTIRTWYRLYEAEGLKGIARLHYEGGVCRLSEDQLEKLKAWITATLPRTTREVGAWIEQEFGIEYESRCGLVALLHRLGMEHRKPQTVSRKLDPAKQEAFIKAYNALLNHLEADEAVLFADAVHPTHAVRPVGCWAPKETPVAVEQTSGRQRLNIHGAIDLETGQTRMLDVTTVDAVSTIQLMIALMAMYPRKRVIHLFLDNARYHHAKLVQEWLKQPGCRITLHFIPAYCPHLDPIERLWGLMHRHITHNTTHATFKQFSEAVLTFLREEVPRKWQTFCDEVTDNFRIISPDDFRVLA
jgi:transposase